MILVATLALFLFVDDAPITPSMICTHHGLWDKQVPVVAAGAKIAGENFFILYGSAAQTYIDAINGELVAEGSPLKFSGEAIGVTEDDDGGALVALKKGVCVDTLIGIDPDVWADIVKAVGVPL